MIWLVCGVASVAAAAAAGAQIAAAPPEGAGPIAALQQQLKQAGYPPGPVNGVMTEQTRQALAAYLQRHRRPPEALAASGMDPVRRAQAGLQRLGMFDGPPDGVVGPATRDAIIRFEASRQLAVDPRVSDRLLAELDRAGAGGGVAGSTTAPPPAAAPSGAPQAAPSSTPQAAPSSTPQVAPSSTPQAPPSGAPEALGRRALPSGVNPPPIR